MDYAIHLGMAGDVMRGADTLSPIRGRGAITLGAVDVDGIAAVVVQNEQRVVLAHCALAYDVLRWSTVYFMMYLALMTAG